MGAGRHFPQRPAFFQQLFQLFDHQRIQHMLNGIGVAVHA